jgi:hypothetical protein
MNFRSVFAAGAVAAALFAGPTSASVIYQSIPDLTVAPVVNGYCSDCAGSLGQYIGQQFVLGSAATAQSASFVVGTNYVWPTSVTVDIFANVGATLGANLFHQTFASFASEVPTAFNTSVVTVGLGNVALAAGDYSIWFSNPDSLSIPAFVGSGLVGIVGGNTGPMSGNGFGGAGQATGVLIEGGAVPEPMAWVLMIGGFAAAGGALRRRRAFAA